MQSTTSSQTGRSREPRRPLLDHRRRSELFGFLLWVLALLIVLSLLSYHRLDPSLDTSTASTAVHNLVGIAGSYTADALLQLLGWTAFLAPLLLFIVGGRWILVRPLESPRTKMIGTALLIGSLAALLELFPHTPLVFGVIHGSGLLGYVLAGELVQTLNTLGAIIVAGAVLLSSLFLMTTFSFSSTGNFLANAVSEVARPLAKRWSAWRAAREKLRLQRRMARERVLGKEPVVASRTASSASSQPSKIPVTADTLTENAPQEDEEPQEAEIPVVMTSFSETVRERLSGGNRAAAPKIAAKAGHKYRLPSTTLLRQPDDQQGIDESELKERAAQVTSKFAEFGVTGNVTQIHPGPVVTTFEFKPEAGIKYSRITNLVDDLCLAMKAESILIERIPGKSTVGIEVPNLHREIIYLREILESSEFAAPPSRMTLCLGKDITGKVKVGDLAQMPHLLIAGSTGSGKSVSINSFIMSILFRSTPDEVRMILIDPKRLELNLYDGIPHLFTPIVTEPKIAANVLRRATLEMEERLKKLAQHGVRNIEQYNKIFEPDSTLDLFDANGQADGPLPYLVIVIDELADLMMVEPQNVEESITRLAQMARAVGIHLILATQRPSVDVITGLIKANLPSRISFRVASKVDSRTILDSNGAEALLGKGDLLFMPPATSRLVRLHGPFVTEKEINKVVEWWKSQSVPQYNEEFLKPIRDRDHGGEPEDEDEDISAELDAVYEDAVRIVVESGKASTSLLQRRLRLGYGRAARLLDLMQKDGIISSPDGSKPREVLKRPEWLQEVDEPLR
jgi:S-DNA-T family DNA segregation ATPase FtsK/SpoIIIE